MLISTMNDKEKRDQVMKDTREISRYIRYTLHKKLDREVKKFNKFPRILRSSYITKSGNKYHLLFRADSRNEFDKYTWGLYYTIMDSDEGKYAMMASTELGGEGKTFQIYSPHLFARYSERCGVNLYEEERIHRFMEESLGKEYGVMREYEEGKMMAPVKTGLVLGDKIGDTVVFKTFVDFERLYEDQIEEGNAAIESFQERIGHYEMFVRWRRKFKKP